MSIRAYRAYYHYLSGNAEYFFIHIPKNAGVAIRHSPLLRGRVVGAEPGFHITRVYAKNLKKVMAAAGEHHGYHHARYRDIRPSVLAKLKPVAIVRNPWARVYSRYKFAERAILTGTAKPDYVPDTFEGFLEERHEYGNKDLYWHRAIRGWFPQLDYVVNDEGNIAVDLLRQENLGEEAMQYFGLDAPIARKNSSEKNSKSPSYKNAYNTKTTQIVADWYHKDIEAFGFDFDTMASKNTVYSKIK